MQRTYFFPSVAAASGPKGLNRKDFAFFHLGLIRVLNKRNCLLAVDMVVLDVMAAEVAHWFDGVRFAADLDFVALHRLLNGGTDVTDANIDAGGL